MPVKLKVIRASDFLNLDADGEYNFESSKELLVQIALAKKPPADFDVLLDLRDARFNLSTTEVWYLAAELESHREAFREKLAILISSQTSVNQVEFFDLCATNRGFSVDVFLNFEDAIDWLFPPENISSE